MADEGRRRIVLVGGGGHAKVILETLRGSPAAWDIVGIVDPDPELREVMGTPVLGDDSHLPKLRDQGVNAAFIAIGDNRLRERLAQSVTGLGFELINAISPAATVSPSARLGRGLAIMAGAVVNAEAVLGDLAIINTGALIDHEVEVGHAAHVAPGCAVSGRVQIGARALLGVGVSVLPDRRIGEDAIVGGGACVTQDIAKGVTAVGVPARAVTGSRSEVQP